jgi:hypothetical protein
VSGGALVLKLGELQSFPIGLEPFYALLDLVQAVKRLVSDIASKQRVDSGLLSDKLRLLRIDL